MTTGSRNSDYEIDSDFARMDVDRDHRGRGQGTLVSKAVIAKLRPLGLKRVLLSTIDAHEVYARVGFVPMPNPERLMILGP